MRVAILYNAPAPPARGRPEDSLSMEGVLDQVEAVARALDELGIEHSTIAVRTGEELVRAIAGIQGESVFNLVEEIDDRIDNQAIVPFMCDLRRIPCTGGGCRSMMLSQDKYLAGLVLSAKGVPRPKARLVPPGGRLDPDLPPFPLIVKPLREDAGLGIWDDSVARDPAGLVRAIERVWAEYRQPALVESFVGEREINVSVLEGPDAVRILPPAEIDFSSFPAEKPRIVGYAAKWVDTSFEFQHTDRIIPAPLAPGSRAEVERVARLAWDAVECRDYARVDLRLDRDERPFVIEVNPNPDISPWGGFAAALQAGGVAFREFVRQILGNAAARVGAQC